MLTGNVLLQAGLLVGGSIWCGQMLRRSRADLHEFRSAADLPTRVGIAVPWLATLAIGVYVLSLVGRMVGSLVT
jgi:hypothetical protein